MPQAISREQQVPVPAIALGAIWCDLVLTSKPELPNLSPSAMSAYLRITVGGLLILEKVKVIEYPSRPEQAAPES
jgi:hypothetical protein